MGTQDRRIRKTRAVLKKFTTFSNEREKCETHYGKRVV